jgi:hypothetical protein
MLNAWGFTTENIKKRAFILHRPSFSLYRTAHSGTIDASVGRQIDSGFPSFNS